MIIWYLKCRGRVVTNVMRTLVTQPDCCKLIGTISPLSDIPMFYIKYPTMHKMDMHAGAMRQYCMVCAYVREDNPPA